MKQLNEGLNYKDMVNHVTPVLGIDQFKSQIGDDSDIIVINFLVSGKEVGNDLVAWLERGYDWIIDAEVSPGEVMDKKFYVFAELERRTSAAPRIIELLGDLYTLTDLKLDKWKLKIKDDRYPATEETIKSEIPLSPTVYKKMDDELNEWREIAGIPVVAPKEKDEVLLQWKRQAGII